VVTEPAITLFAGANRFLSNFYSAEIPIEGILYASVEHAYQAMKTLDELARLEIARTPSASLAKQMGKKLVLRPGWNEMRLETMAHCVRIKFGNPILKRRLLETGDRQLVEGNYWGDTFWGVCRGSGENHLGRILMETRTYYRG
jgi:N-glycosidase YbiA